MKALALALMLFAVPLAAQVHKCTNLDGSTSYQQTPCDDQQATEKAPLIMRAPTPVEPEVVAEAFEPGAHERHSSQHAPMPSYQGAPPPAPRGRVGMSQYAAGGMSGQRCTRPNGTVYYAARCGANYESRSGSAPIHGMTSDGSFVHGQLMWQESQRIDHQSETVSIDEACEGAKAGRESLIRRGGSSSALRVASQRVYQMCQRGRSLYDLGR